MYQTSRAPASLRFRYTQTCFAQHNSRDARCRPRSGVSLGLHGDFCLFVRSVRSLRQAISSPPSYSRPISGKSHKSVADTQVLVRPVCRYRHHRSSSQIWLGCPGRTKSFDLQRSSCHSCHISNDGCNAKGKLTHILMSQRTRPLDRRT